MMCFKNRKFENIIGISINFKKDIILDNKEYFKLQIMIAIYNLQF